MKTMQLYQCVKLQQHDCMKLCVDPYFPSKASKRLKDPESKEPNGFELLLKVMQ